MAGALPRDRVENPPRTEEIPARPVPIHTTLLELVTLVTQFADDEREVVETVTRLVNSGRVILRGSFADRGLPIF